MNYDLSKPLAPQVDREFAEQLCERLGHAFTPDRLDRIAKDARSIFDEGGFPMAFAFAEAIDMEILLYGDPNAKGGPFVGLMNSGL